jgi:hypothetical protein
VCHIAAQNAGGSRFDAAQSDEERHGFNNLILMCPIHHDVIDADEEAYSVDRLLRFKAERETIAEQVQPLNDEQAEKFIALVHAPTVIGGSIITTMHQTGGQVAHTINNTFGTNAPPPLTSPVAADYLLSPRLLRERLAPFCVTGDGAVVRQFIRAQRWMQSALLPPSVPSTRCLALLTRAARSSFVFTNGRSLSNLHEGRRANWTQSGYGWRS